MMSCRSTQEVRNPIEDVCSIAHGRGARLGALRRGCAPPCSHTLAEAVQRACEAAWRADCGSARARVSCNLIS
jgi:hypothetical protein